MIIERNTCYIRVVINDPLVTPAMARALAGDLERLAEEIAPMCCEDGCGSPAVTFVTRPWCDAHRGGGSAQPEVQVGAADEEAKAQASEGWMMSYGQRLTGPRQVSNLTAALNGFDAGWAARAAQPAGASAREPPHDVTGSRLADGSIFIQWVEGQDGERLVCETTVPEAAWWRLTSPEPIPLPDGATHWDTNPGKSLRLWWNDEAGNECYTDATYGALASRRLCAGELQPIDTPVAMARAVLSRTAAKAGQ